MAAGLFVTGTDTGVGKSVVAASLVAALRARGEDVVAVKPLLTGLDEPPGPGEWPADHELLAAAAGSDPRSVAAFTFGPAVSPHLAAQLAGTTIDPDAVIAATRAATARGDVAIVEGVGGLLVPIAPGFDVRDLAAALGYPIIVVARPALGTINHTLLTLEAARARALDVRAVVLTPWPEEPTAMELSNRDTIAELGEIDVLVLGRTAPDDLTAPGQALLDGCWTGIPQHLH
jgi:dethiobiotin synthetase